MVVCPSLVFIPGGTLSARLWTEQLNHFSEDRLAVALDLRSQAESAQSLVNNTPEGRARDLQELVGRLGIRNFVIVGWSQGAQDVAALAGAERHGSRDSVSSLRDSRGRRPRIVRR